MNVLRNRRALLMGSMTALVGFLSPATGFATGVCYAFTDSYPTVKSPLDGGPPIVIRYIPVGVGAINSDAEAASLGHLKQWAYSLVGKATTLINIECEGPSAAVCPLAPADGLQQVRLMTTVDGTIITGKAVAPYASADSPGAHMGIDMQFLRHVPDFSDFPIGPVTLECTSSQVSPTPITWQCNIKAQFDVPISDTSFLVLAERKPITLTRVNPATNPACSVFQDGGLTVPD